MPELESERLRIRPMVVGDETAVHRLLHAVGWTVPYLQIMGMLERPDGTSDS